MGFKLGKEKRGFKGPDNTPIFRKKLEPGVKAEANNDGSINVDPSVKLNSEEGKRILRHEKKHLDDMKSGKAAYGDNWVSWKDKIYLRREVDGKKVIDGPNGRLPEGHPDHPWEKEAIAAEKKVKPDTGRGYKMNNKK
tara:strand:- start:16 stop:429 length:414 start_codon:yes stop_codon:yes gene_type:complete